MTGKSWLFVGFCSTRKFGFQFQVGSLGLIGLFVGRRHVDRIGAGRLFAQTRFRGWDPGMQTSG